MGDNSRKTKNNENNNNSGNYIGSEVDTDWQNEAFQRGKIFAADFSAQGGNDKLKYFTSLSYNNSEGILVSNAIEKISARLNIDNKVNKFIDLGFALSLNRTDIDQVSDDNSFSTPMQLVALSPVTPVRDLDGNLYDIPTTTYYNGLIDVENATRDIIEYRSVANGYLSFNLLSGLKWRNELGFDLYNLKENARYGEKTDTGTGVNGYGFTNYGQTQNLTTKSYLDYLDNIGDIGVSAVLGPCNCIITKACINAVSAAGLILPAATADISAAKSISRAIMVTVVLPLVPVMAITSQS